MKFSPRGIPALVMIVAAPQVVAVDTAAELARIDNESRETAIVLMRPQRLLRAEFEAALEKAGEDARQSGDIAGELAAIKASQDLHDDLLGAGKIDHPEVLRLCKAFVGRKNQLARECAPQVAGVRKRHLANLKALTVRLGNSGQFQDAAQVKDIVAKLENGQTTMPWLDGFEAPGRAAFFELPESMRARSDASERLVLIEAGGGDARSEEAVMKGLLWLKSTQNQNGSWTSANQCSMTGLALLAYLGHGESPHSEEFGDSVLKAVTYLVGHGAKNSGLLSSSNDNNQMPYEHAIATQALAEAAIQCAALGITIPHLRETVAKAGRLIIGNQHPSGGWDYGYSEASARGGDLSVTSWQVGALAACRNTGMEFTNLDECLNKATGYVGKRQAADGGFGYAARGDSHAPNGYHTLTGAGMFCLQKAGKAEDGGVRRGADYLRKNSRFHYNGADCDLYGHFFESQATRLRGREPWEIYHAKVFDQILDAQNEDGSWKVPGGGKKTNAVAPAYLTNVHYRNCLCILLLEIYYRELPE